MSKNAPTIARILPRSSGEFNASNWVAEGDGLIASSAMTRKAWTDHRQEFSRKARARTLQAKSRADDWHLLLGLPRASMLLLGYAAEMYLKAGLAKAYKGCSEEMFKRDSRNRFGHNLTKLANEIAFPFAPDDKAHFSALTDMIVADARYPVSVPNGESFAELVNRRTEKIWSSENFKAFTELCHRVREHAQRIDSDSNNPCSCSSWTIDGDGYLAFRCGGHLPPRITYRFSCAQKANGDNSLDDMKSLFRGSEFLQLTSWWERALIYEDSNKRTSCRACPPLSG